MFNSPTEWCPIVREWVALDESVVECARVHHCKVEDCPLARLSASEEPKKLPPSRATEAFENPSKSSE
jgi:hypothetical protein